MFGPEASRSRSITHACASGFAIPHHNVTRSFHTDGLSALRPDLRFILNELANGLAKYREN